MAESDNPFTREFFTGPGGEAGFSTFQTGGESGIGRERGRFLASEAAKFGLVPQQLQGRSPGDQPLGLFRFGQGGAAPAAAAPAAAAPIVAPEAVAEAPATVFDAPATPIGQSLIGAINRSSGDTGSSALNARAVERARLAGVDRANLVSSVDRSRQRSPAGGILAPSQQADFDNVISPLIARPNVTGLSSLLTGEKKIDGSGGPIDLPFATRPILQ